MKRRRTSSDSRHRQALYVLLEKICAQKTWETENRMQSHDKSQDAGAVSLSIIVGDLLSSTECTTAHHAIPASTPSDNFAATTGAFCRFRADSHEPAFFYPKTEPSVSRPRASPSGITASLAGARRCRRTSMVRFSDMENVSKLTYNLFEVSFSFGPCLDERRCTAGVCQLLRPCKPPSHKRSLV